MFDFLPHLRNRPDSDQDTMLTVHLEHALTKGGCPLCYLTATAELRYFEGLWYENVNDPGVSKTIMQSRAFCTEHTQAVFAGRLEVLSPSGVAILFGRLLRRLHRAATNDSSLLNWLHPEAPCPVCVARARNDRAYLPEFARQATRQAITGAKPAVLCIPHLRAFASHSDAATWASQQESSITRIAQYETASARERLALVVGRAPVNRLPSDPTCPACQAAARGARTARDTSAVCRLHAWTLYDDVEHDAIVAVRDVAPTDGCQACQAATMAVETTLMTLENGAPLCLGHLRAALGHHRPVRVSAVAALDELSGALKRFADSFDYQYTGTRTDSEIASWTNVLARFGGESVESAVALSLPFTPEARRGEDG